MESWIHRTLAIGIAFAGIIVGIGVWGGIPELYDFIPYHPPVEGGGAFSLVMGGITLWLLSQWSNVERRKTLSVGMGMVAALWFLGGIDLVFVSPNHLSVLNPAGNIPLGVKAAVIVWAVLTGVVASGYISTAWARWVGFVIGSIGLISLVGMAWYYGMGAPFSASIPFGSGVVAAAYLLMGILLFTLNPSPLSQPKPVVKKRANRH